MSTFRCVVVTVGAIATLIPSALSQDREPGGRGTGNINIAQNEELQKELKLTADQLQKIKVIPGLIREHLKDQFLAMEKLEGPARREASKDLRKLFTEQYPKELAKILTPEQMKRVEQISIQQDGVHAFLRPEVEKALTLTEDQVDKLKVINQALHKEGIETYLKASGEENATTKVAALNKEMLARAEALLTDKQRQKWKELQGEPIVVKLQPSRPVKRSTPEPDPADSEPLVITEDDLSWIDKRIEEWQANEDERGIDRIGWAPSIREALRLGRENNRLVFLFNYSGQIGAGRC